MAARDTTPSHQQRLHSPEMSCKLWSVQNFCLVYSFCLLCILTLAFFLWLFFLWICLLRFFFNYFDCILTSGVTVHYDMMHRDAKNMYYAHRESWLFQATPETTVETNHFSRLWNSVSATELVMFQLIIFPRQFLRFGEPVVHFSLQF